MYRIELAPGEEALFRNMDELAKGRKMEKILRGS